MKWATLGLILLGIAGAVCAAILVAVFRATPPHTTEDPAQREVKVLVATMNLPAMTMLDIMAVDVISIPLSERPQDALSDPTPVIGRVLRVPVLEGQALTREHFATSGTGVHLAAILPEGYRAVTLALDQSGSLEGLLYPGGVVDVMAHFRLIDGEIRGESISTTLLERVPVLAIEDRTVVGSEAEPAKSGAGRTGRRLVTLRVTPQQAAQLQLAAEHGSVSLAMRNPLDNAVPEPIRVLLSSLSYADQSWIAHPAEQLVPPAPEKLEPPASADVVSQPAADDATDTQTPTWKVVIIRGNTQETHSLPLENAAPGQVIVNQ